MEFQTVPPIDIKSVDHTYNAVVEGTTYRFGTSLLPVDIQYRTWLRTASLVQVIGAILCGVGAIGYGVSLFLTSITTLSTSTLRSTTSTAVLASVSFGLLCLLFAWYRAQLRKPVVSSLLDIGHEKSSGSIIDIWTYATPDTRMVLETSVRLAAAAGHTSVTPAHLMLALLEQERIRVLCIRLSLSVDQLRAQVAAVLAPVAAAPQVAPTLADAWLETVLYSGHIARTAQQGHIDVTELLPAVILHDVQLQEVFYAVEIEYQKIQNMLLWVRTQKQLEERHSKERAGAAHMSKYGLDRAMTAVATPFLNSLSHDITRDVARGYTEPCVARDAEIAAVLQTIESGRPNIILIGEHGVGKRSIIEGIAARIIADDVPPTLHDKRVIELSLSALVAGTTVSGAQDRLMRAIREIQRARNIILFIDNIHDLMGASDTGLDLSETLAELITNGSFVLFATTTPQGYAQQISHATLGTALAEHDVAIMDVNQSIQVLESKAPFIEYQEQVFFTYQSIETSVQLAKKLLQQHVLPESAIGILKEAGSHARAARGIKTLVRSEDVAQVISKKTGVPVAAITEDESEKLLKLEAALHERVVGQDEAVVLVANALRRARAAIRATTRPIANFLFLGPTGVGKTELAKTIADVYFGGEEHMIRLDMSEYQDTSSVYRLIGEPGKPGTGIFTEAIRKQPFSLILLDEMEKADPHVLNIFLQVFDDGRITDSVGSTVDCTNTIIIATSNAGTSYVQTQLAAGVSYEQIQTALLHGQLQDYYRPEFLNRFDGIVLFRALTQTDIAAIAERMLQRISRDLEPRGIALEITPEAISHLADIGFDPDFGARPMRRAIQDTVESRIADLMLTKQVGRRDTIRIEGELLLRVIPPS